MGRWFNDRGKNERVNYNTPLPGCDTLNGAKIARLGSRPPVIGGTERSVCTLLACTRVRTLVRLVCQQTTKYTGGRTGWRTTGRPGQPSGDSRDAASHSRPRILSSRIRILLRLIRFSFIHPFILRFLLAFYFPLILSLFLLPFISFLFLSSRFYIFLPCLRARKMRARGEKYVAKGARKHREERNCRFYPFLLEKPSPTPSFSCGQPQV